MKLTLLSSLLLLSIAAAAQIKKGAVSIGGDIAFSFSKSSSIEPNSFERKFHNGSISISAGKAIKDNLFIGAGFLYSASADKYTSTANGFSNEKSHSYGGFLWTRKYYPVLKSFYIFLNGTLSVSGYLNNQTSSSPATRKLNSTLVGVAVFPGISYQLGKRFFLDASLNNLASINYNYSKSTITDTQNNTTNTNSESTFGFSSSIGNGSNPLQAGIRWIITK